MRRDVISVVGSCVFDSRDQIGESGHQRSRSKGRKAPTIGSSGWTTQIKSVSSHQRRKEKRARHGEARCD